MQKVEKRRRAEVRNPANQKIEAPGMVGIFRFEPNVANEIARMVERHHNHCELAHNVDRGYSSMALIGNWKSGFFNGNLLCQS